MEQLCTLCGVRETILNVEQTDACKVYSNCLGGDGCTHLSAEVSKCQLRDQLERGMKPQQYLYIALCMYTRSNSKHDDEVYT